MFVQRDHVQLSHLGQSSPLVLAPVDARVRLR